MTSEAFVRAMCRGGCSSRVATHHAPQHPHRSWLRDLPGGEAILGSARARLPDRDGTTPHPPESATRRCPLCAQGHRGFQVQTFGVPREEQTSETPYISNPRPAGALRLLRTQWAAMPQQNICTHAKTAARIAKTISRQHVQHATTAGTQTATVRPCTTLTTAHWCS